MRYIHQVSESVKHRLGRPKYDAKSPTKESPVIWGEWASYQAPAMLGKYLAVTEYYRAAQSSQIRSFCIGCKLTFGHWRP